MNNPLRILHTLDRHLTAPAELTMFGRAALALGYAGSPAAFATTQPEIQELFRAAQPKVLALAGELKA